jgi:ABC-type nitrate/sulfonate/bicarbonate transport system ATPase subunit
LSEGQPLFALEQARIESGGSTTEPWSARGGERLVALVGYFSPLFRLLRREARLMSGAVRLAGKDAVESVRAGAVALASREAPAADWTTERYLEQGMRLAHGPVRRDQERMRALLASFGLAGTAARRLRELPPADRRLVSLARAILSDAAALCVEAPLSELATAEENRVADALEEVARERRLILSFPAEPLGGRARQLFERADFTVAIRRGVVV